MLRGLFGHLIFAIIARMLCGNHLNNLLIFFFPVSGHSLLKDVVVAFSVLVATIGCWMAVLQKRKAKEQMERMIKDMKILQQAEDGLQELQIRFFS